MDSVAVTVPLRQPTKKMKKRKELDALAPPHAVSRRSSGKRSSQELLTDSSDERSEYWNISARSGRKCRGRRSRACPGFLKACSAFLACASVLATTSLIWLFIDVRQQLTALRTELDQVIAGNEGVPDALQKCHSLSRDLQNNQTIIFSHLSELRLQINNFTLQLAGIQHGLHQVQEWVHDTPELAKLPKKLSALSNSVVSFGSKIQDLGATVNTLKETNARVQQDQTTMLQNISSIEHAVLEISNITQRPQMLITNETKIKTDELNAAILRLNNSLIHINETLSREIKWVYDDWKKDHDLLVRLQETSQNVSMEVISLQREYAKLSEQTTILASAQKSNDQINKMHTTDVELDEKVKHLEQLYNNLKNSTDFLVAAMPDIQSQELNKGKGIEEGIHRDATTEREISVLEEAPVKKASASKPKRLSVNPE